MFLKYADDEMKMFKERANDGNGQAEDMLWHDLVQSLNT